MTNTLSPDHHSAADVVRLLGLAPMDREGGFFRRTIESAVPLPGSNRRMCSAIYFLLTPDGFSALHRVAADEIWCFHAGDPLELLQLAPGAGPGWTRLGLDLAAGQQPQLLVPAGEWQGARLAAGGRWALVTCVVAPEFTWDTFELGDRAALGAEYPAATADIAALTRLEPPRGTR